MNDINTLTTFLGWCSIINVAVLCFASLLLVVMRDLIQKIHSRLLGIDMNLLPGQYLTYLGNYKIMVFVFNLVPYFALKIMF